MLPYPVFFINTPNDLEQTLPKLEDCDEIAIDLEFDKNYYRFGFNLCLVQIFDGSRCWLIDPLSRNMDISLLFPVLEDPSITKVCFSFDEDLRLLHSLGCFPQNLFDLDTASRLLNYPAMSLTNILKEVLSTDPGESSQRSNWYNRPLTKKQMNYAANDVLHLLKLKHELTKRAESRGILEWIEEENCALNELDYSDIDDNNIIKEKEKKQYNELEWHIYKKLVNWRHELAEKYNKPAFQVVGKSVLTDLVKNHQQYVNWQNMKGIYQKIKTREYEDEINQILQSARQDALNQNLCETRPAQKPLDKGEYKKMMDERKKINRLKNDIFQPVKNRIEEKYGAEAASFMLSNRIISDMITGNNGAVKRYKKKLIAECAEELGIDTASFAEIVQLNTP